MNQHLPWFTEYFLYFWSVFDNTKIITKNLAINIINGLKSLNILQKCSRYWWRVQCELGKTFPCRIFQVTLPHYKYYQRVGTLGLRRSIKFQFFLQVNNSLCPKMLLLGADNGLDSTKSLLLSLCWKLDWVPKTEILQRNR